MKLTFQWWCQWKNKWFLYLQLIQFSLWGDVWNELIVMDIDNIWIYKESKSNLCLSDQNIILLSRNEPCRWKLFQENKKRLNGGRGHENDDFANWSFFNLNIHYLCVILHHKLFLFFFIAFPVLLLVSWYL